MLLEHNLNPFIISLPKPRLLFFLFHIYFFRLFATLCVYILSVLWSASADIIHVHMTDNSEWRERERNWGSSSVDCVSVRHSELLDMALPDISDDTRLISTSSNGWKKFKDHYRNTTHSWGQPTDNRITNPRSLQGPTSMSARYPHLYFKGFDFQSSIAQFGSFTQIGYPSYPREPNECVRTSHEWVTAHNSSVFFFSKST